MGMGLLVATSGLLGQQISPMLVGNNAWYTNPSQEVWDLTAACGVGSIRIGGHAFDDAQPSLAQLENWVKRIQEMGAEPIIQVSQYRTLEQAASVVKHFNIDSATGIPVIFWNIGNEPWLQNGRPSTSTVGAMVEAYFKPISEAMKAVDSTIKIYGPDLCYYMEPAINDLFGGKNDIAGTIPGKSYYYCDGISWHSYPQDGNLNLAYGGIDHFKSAIIKCKAKVDQVNQAKGRTGEDALGWGIGEFNAKEGALVHTWENGQMFGGILNLCMKYEATYATTWSMFENGGSRQGTDFSFIDGANMTPRASYRHMEMVAKYLKSNYLEGTSSDPDIIVFGSSWNDTTSVMIMNRAEDPAIYTLYLNMDSILGSGTFFNIDVGSGREHMDLIPGRSTQLFVFGPDSSFRLEYTERHFDTETPPLASWVWMVSNPPSPPGQVTSPGSTYKSIDLQWKFPSGDTITGFSIERKTAGSDEFAIIGSAGPEDSAFTDSGLEAMTAYTYRIRALNSAGFSPYSVELTTETQQLPEKIAFNGPHSIPGRIEAEDYNDNEEGIGYHDSEPANQGGAYRPEEGVDLEACTDEGGGYNVGYIESGEWLEYRIESIQDGNYDIAIRTASNTAGSKSFSLYLGDDFLGSAYAGYTGGWQNWETIRIEDVEITGGDDQILRVNMQANEFNINWIEFLEVMTGYPSVHVPVSIHVHFDPMNRVIEISNENDPKDLQIRLLDLAGKVHFLSDEKMLRSASYHLDLSPGIYILQIQGRDFYDNRKIMFGP
jgi:hypothetical protein